MSDLIDRQAAIDAIAKFVPYAIYDESTESYKNGLMDAYNLICQLPTVEPKTGRWIRDRLVTTNGGTYGVRRCSECEAYYQDIGYKWNFCPNCGAYMKEESDETD